MSEDAINSHAVLEPSAGAGSSGDSRPVESVGVLDYRTPEMNRKRRFAHPPGVVFHSFVAVIALATFWFWRVPYGDGLWSLGVWLIWFALGVVWLWKVARRWIIPGYEPVTAPRRLWFVFPIAFPVMIALVWLNIPVRLGFLVSRPQLSAIANIPSYNPRWAGVYKVERINRAKGGTIIQIGLPPGIFEISGYAHFPTATPQADLYETYTPLGNGWYIYHWVD